ncbi:MAG: mechanosensitive ion channel family protein [Pseudomonadota bacterium]|nr:mechanosensitive ion channel family protein [Pseudomonadota bacterium]
MRYVILDNDLSTWAIAFGIGLAVYLLLYLAKRIVVRRLGRFAATTATYLDDLAVMILAATHPLFIMIIAVYAGTHSLALSDTHVTLLSRLTIATLLIQVARWGDTGVSGWLHHYRVHRAGHDPASATSTAALGFVARAVIWLVVILMILDNFGVNITTLVASLGIGGIAVALALQNILGDLFSSLSIVLDKPFVVGDFINVDDISGTVEHVGMKTTRIRGLGGEQVIFSNSDLLKSRIRNFKRMQTRRIVFGIGVTYDTSQPQLAAIPDILREIVRAQPEVAFDRAHFSAFGPSSLDFETVYIMQRPDYAAYMDAQQAINMALFERFASEGIEFAFPTQTLYLSRPNRPFDAAA